MPKCGGLACSGKKFQDLDNFLSALCTRQTNKIESVKMPKRKTTAEDVPVQDHKMRDDDESSSDVRL